MAQTDHPVIAEPCGGLPFGRPVLEGGFMGSTQSRRQGNIDCCALPQFRLAAYGATVSLNDSIYGGKSQASALTHLFGGVESLENLVESVRLNPSARVDK